MPKLKTNLHKKTNRANTTMPTKTQLAAKHAELENKLDQIRELLCGDDFLEKNIHEMDARNEIDVYCTFSRRSRRSYKSPTPTFNFDFYSKYAGHFPILTRSYSIDDFLKSSEEVYGCGDDGWGILLIEDLEKLKKGVQERIDAMKKAIETETYETP
jgi:hypothetical protein